MSARETAELLLVVGRLVQTSKGKKALARDPFEVLVRRGFARRERANRDAPRPAPGVDHFSCEWGASALRCLPGLHVPQWRDALQPNKRELLGPRMPTARGSD